jgi:hypothetical protein
VSYRQIYTFSDDATSRLRCSSTISGCSITFSIFLLEPIVEEPTNGGAIGLELGLEHCIPIAILLSQIWLGLGYHIPIAILLSQIRLGLGLGLEYHIPIASSSSS